MSDNLALKNQISFHKEDASESSSFCNTVLFFHILLTEVKYPRRLWTARPQIYILPLISAACQSKTLSSWNKYNTDLKKKKRKLRIL